MQRRLQITDTDGLGNVIIHAGLQTLFAIAYERVAGHGDDARAFPGGPTLTNLAGRFEAIHLRHLHVEKQYVVGLLFQRLEDFQAVAGNVSAVPQLVQDTDTDLLVDGIVIGQEQMQRQAAGEIGVERRRDRRFLLALNVDAQGPAHGIEQLRRVDRFMDGDRNTGGQWTRTITAGVPRRQQEQWRVTPGRLLADFLGQRETIFVRQFQIEDHGIKQIALRQQRERVAAVRSRFHGHAPILAALRDDAPVGGVVFDDQQALARKLGLRVLPGRRLAGGGCPRRDRKMECGPLARIALDPDLPPKQLRQAFADGQTQSGAAIVTGGGGIDLLK